MQDQLMQDPLGDFPSGDGNYYPDPKGPTNRNRNSNMYGHSIPTTTQQVPGTAYSLPAQPPLMTAQQQGQYGQGPGQPLSREDTWAYPIGQPQALQMQQQVPPAGIHHANPYLQPGMPYQRHETPSPLWLDESHSSRVSAQQAGGRGMPGVDVSSLSLPPLANNGRHPSSSLNNVVYPGAVPGQYPGSGGGARISGPLPAAPVNYSSPHQQPQQHRPPRNIRLIDSTPVSPGGDSTSVAMSAHNQQAAMATQEQFNQLLGQFQALAGELQVIKQHQQQSHPGINNTYHDPQQQQQQSHPGINNIYNDPQQPQQQRAFGGTSFGTTSQQSGGSSNHFQQLQQQQQLQQHPYQNHDPQQQQRPHASHHARSISAESRSAIPPTAGHIPASTLSSTCFDQTKLDDRKPAAEEKHHRPLASVENAIGKPEEVPCLEKYHVILGASKFATTLTYLYREFIRGIFPKSPKVEMSDLYMMLQLAYKCHTKGSTIPDYAMEDIFWKKAPSDMDLSTVMKVRFFEEEDGTRTTAFIPATEEQIKKDIEKIRTRYERDQLPLKKEYGFLRKRKSGAKEKTKRRAVQNQQRKVG